MLISRRTDHATVTPAIEYKRVRTVDITFIYFLKPSIQAKSGALTEVTFFILLSLYTPKRGYAIMQFIENETKGRLLLVAGT